MALQVHYGDSVNALQRLWARIGTCGKLNMKVLYVRGKTILETTLNKEGKTQYTGLTVEEYNSRWNVEAEVFDLDIASKMVEDACDKKYLRGWEEITEERYDEMLGVLPPEAWTVFNGLVIWRICEWTHYNITDHYAQYDGKFYGSCLRTDNMKNLGKNLLKQIGN